MRIGLFFMWKASDEGTGVNILAIHPCIKNIPLREFNFEEKKIFDKLMSVDFEGKSALEKQLAHSQISGYCDCGCRSIRLSCSPTISKVSINERIPVERDVIDEDGVPVHFLLHVLEGYVYELEIFRADSEPLIVLPDVREALFSSR